MRPEILLDGKHVGPKDLDPALHRFVGMWRPPFVEVVQMMQGLQTWPVNRYHFEQPWRDGAWDIPQYVTIKEIDHGEKEKP